MQVLTSFRTFLIIAATLLTTAFISGTNPYWQEGTVVLESNEKITGDVFLDHRTHIVLVRQDNIVKAFPAHKVMGFNYLDDYLELDRKFIAYDLEIRKGVRRKVFLEIIFDGAIPLLRKEKRIPHTATKKANSDRTYEHEHDYMYYAMVNNELIELCQFQEKILPFITKNQGKEIQAFLKDQRMKDHVLGHQIKIIDHYNFLSNPEYSKLDYDLALLD